MGRLVFSEINAVVDDADPIFTDVEKRQDVAFGLFGDGDDSISHLKGRLLHPEAEIIASSELLSFPRAEGL